MDPQTTSDIGKGANCQIEPRIANAAIADTMAADGDLRLAPVGPRWKRSRSYLTKAEQGLAQLPVRQQQQLGNDDHGGGHPDRGRCGGGGLVDQRCSSPCFGFNFNQSLAWHSSGMAEARQTSRCNEDSLHTMT